MNKKLTLALALVAAVFAAAAFAQKPDAAGSAVEHNILRKEKS